MIFGGREIVFRVSSVSCAESRSKARMQERELRVHNSAGVSARTT